MHVPAFEDWCAVVGQLNELAAIFDGRAWDRLGEVVAPDATAYGLHGIDALLRDNLRRHLGGCGPSQHLLGNYRVAVDGDVATSATAVRAWHRDVDPASDRTFECVGTYHDTWARTPAGWRLTGRTFQVDATWGDIGVLRPG